MSKFFFSHFLHNMPCPMLVLPLQSKMPKSFIIVRSCCSTPTGENMQDLQSADKSDEVLYLSSPPTTGIATPGFAGFSKSGWYVLPSTPSTFGESPKNRNCTSKWGKQLSGGLHLLKSSLMSTLLVHLTSVRHKKTSSGQLLHSILQLVWPQEREFESWIRSLGHVSMCNLFFCQKVGVQWSGRWSGD